MIKPNQQLKICKAKSLYSEATPCTAGEMAAIMSDPRVKNICDQLKALPKDEAHRTQREQLKRQLPIFCFGASQFVDNCRKNENAKPSGLALLDIDGLDNPKALVESWGDPQRLHTLGVYMTSLSCSGTGLHLVIGRRQGESIEQAQQRVTSVLGVTDYDRGCKDVARASFATPVEYVIQFYPEAFFSSELVTVGPEASESKLPKCIDSADEMIEDAEVIEEIRDDETPEVYEGLPLEQIVQGILRNIMGVTEEPKEGDHNRHNRYIELQGYLRYVCDNQPDVMFKVSPSWGLPEDERRKMCQSVAGYAYKVIPRCLRRELDRLKAELAGTKQAGQRNRHRPLPKVLPRLFRLLAKIFPQQFLSQMVMAAFPLAGSLTTALRYRKDPYNELATTFFTFVCGPLASGKGFTRVLAQILLQPIVEEDERAQQYLQAWKDEKEASGNGKGPKRPHLIIRQIYPDFTPAALNQQIIDAKEQHLIFFTEESDNFVMDRKFSAKLREAYDGVRTGQTRVSAQSVSGGARSNINMLTCGTPMALGKMMSNPEDGLVSRFYFAMMPVMNGFHPLKWGELNAREQAELDAIIRSLYNIGLIQPILADGQSADDVSPEFLQNTYQKVYVKLPRAERRIKQWTEQLQAEIDANPQQVALARFACRMPDFMRRVALFLYAAEGMKETSASLDLMEWMADEALQTLLDLYGTRYETLCDEQAIGKQVYMRNSKAASIYDTLSDRFTVMDLRAKRKLFGLSDSIDAANTTISRWKSRGMIRLDSTDAQGLKYYAKVHQLEMEA